MRLLFFIILFLTPQFVLSSQCDTFFDEFDVSSIVTALEKGDHAFVSNYFATQSKTHGLIKIESSELFKSFRNMVHGSYNITNREAFQVYSIKALVEYYDLTYSTRKEFRGVSDREVVEKVSSLVYTMFPHKEPNKISHILLDAKLDALLAMSNQMSVNQASWVISNINYFLAAQRTSPNKDLVGLEVKVKKVKRSILKSKGAGLTFHYLFEATFGNFLIDITLTNSKFNKI